MILGLNLESGDTLLSFLDYQTVCRLGIVCREFKTFACNQNYWKALSLKRWPELVHRRDNNEWEILYRRKATTEGDSKVDLDKAMGSLGWYTCPNGHMYAVGECRLPMQIASCPECGARIGGRDHRMLANNTRLHSATFRAISQASQRRAETSYMERKSDRPIAENTSTTQPKNGPGAVFDIDDLFDTLE